LKAKTLRASGEGERKPQITQIGADLDPDPVDNGSDSIQVQQSAPE
jgi:hypothetical protein